VDEKIPELERAVLFLTQGLPVQQRKAIERCATRNAGTSQFQGRPWGKVGPSLTTYAAPARPWRSLPALLRARGRTAFDALQAPLDAALDSLEPDAEVCSRPLARIA
jgi:hypothetical protein